MAFTSNSKGLFKSFLIDRNIHFDKKYPAASLIGFLNIGIIYSAYVSRVCTRAFNSEDGSLVHKV